MANLKFIFDLDGTITSAETLPIIAKKFNVHTEIEQLTRDTINGKIPWRQSFEYRVGLLKHIPTNEIDTLLRNTPVYTEIVSFILSNKDDCCIATGNLDCWIDGLCKKIGCKYYSSTATTSNNKILDISHIIDKSDVVRKLQYAGSKTVFIGDSNNDVSAMNKSDIAIAFGASHKPTDACMAAADYLVKSVSELLDLLQDLDSRGSEGI